MEMRQVRYFAAVARHRHVTRAAAELGLAQPALSQQVRRLERELGVALLDRSRRRIGLTEAGVAFAVWAEQILADVAGAEAEMAEFSGLRRGRVVVGTIPMQNLGRVDLPALLATFGGRHPGIEIVLRESTTNHIVAALLAAQVDIGLGAVMDVDGPPVGIVTEPIFTEDLVVMVNPGHPLAGRRRLQVEELVGESLILTPPGAPTRRAVDRAATAVGRQPSVRFETNDMTLLRTLAARGLGVAVSPRSIAESPGEPVTVVELDGLLGRRTVGLLWSEGRHQSPAVRSFLRLARQRLH